MNLFGLFHREDRDAVNRRTARNERLQHYARYLRAYQGFSVRGVLNTDVIRDWKRIKFNFVQPVVNLSAGWFAAKPIDWDVDGDPAATKEAYRIWDRSGSDAALLENAICCGIYGDLVGLATQDSDGQSKIQFVDPSICEPTFDGADYSMLTALEIAYEARDVEGRSVTRREIWGATEMETYEGDVLVERLNYDRLPAVWIRNSSVKGLPYGLSDVEAILDLVEEYDHLAAKQTRIVDYYATPHMVFSGIQRDECDVVNSLNTVYFLPSEAKVSFLEWSGNTPDVESQLTRIRAAIAEISQVPAVAFGYQDVGGSNLSGVAIQILYGPLINKTHRKQASWGPALQYLMWLCLRAAGHKSVTLEAVNVRFPSGTPVDGQSVTAVASAKVAAKLSSRRTLMNDLGVEDPDAELKRIIIEEKMLQLAEPPGVADTNANTAARAGGKGIFAQEIVAGVGLNKRPANSNADSFKIGERTQTRDADIADLMARYDALLNQEHASTEPTKSASSIKQGAQT
jgi:hypothetical protein